MNKTLFQIADSMMALVDFGVDNETGEIIETEEQFKELFESIELEITTKIDNTNGIIKMIDSDIDLIDNEIKRLQALKKSSVTKKEWLYNNIDRFIRMQCTDEDGELDTEKLHKYKLKLPHSQISYGKSSSVKITDVTLIPTEYKNVKVEEAPDKKKIKEALNNDIVIDGAEIETKYTLKIK